jgi:hypothetical protein
LLFVPAAASLNDAPCLPPPPLRHADNVPPTINIVGALPAEAPASVDTAMAVVPLPELAASDNVTASPIITCDAPGATPSSLTFSKGVSATFPLGSTTVTCRAQDAAGNISPNVTFAVSVVCPTGFAASGTACAGECIAGGRATAK